MGINETELQLYFGFEMISCKELILRRSFDKYFYSMLLVEQDPTSEGLCSWKQQCRQKKFVSSTRTTLPSLDSRYLSDKHTMSAQTQRGSKPHSSQSTMQKKTCSQRNYDQFIAACSGMSIRSNTNNAIKGQEHWFDASRSDEISRRSSYLYSRNEEIVEVTSRMVSRITFWATRVPCLCVDFWVETNFKADPQDCTRYYFRTNTIIYFK